MTSLPPEPLSPQYSLPHTASVPGHRGGGVHLDELNWSNVHTTVCVCVWGGGCRGGKEGGILLTGGRVSRILPGFPTLSIYYPVFPRGKWGPPTMEVCLPQGDRIIVVN